LRVERSDGVDVVIHHDYETGVSDFRRASSGEFSSLIDKVVAAGKAAVLAYGDGGV
jgi:hypothetical protein